MFAVSSFRGLNTVCIRFKTTVQISVLLYRHTQLTNPFKPGVLFMGRRLTE